MHRTARRSRCSFAIFPLHFLLYAHTVYLSHVILVAMANISQHVVSIAFSFQTFRQPNSQDFTNYERQVREEVASTVAAEFYDLWQRFY